MRACILVHTQPGKSQDVVKYIRKLENVTVAYAVFGRTDVVARAEVRNYDALQTLLDETNRVEGVVATETLPELEVS